MEDSKNYKLERMVDGVWYEWGVYSSVSRLVAAAAWLGRMGYEDAKIRVVEV